MTNKASIEYIEYIENKVNKLENNISVLLNHQDRILTILEDLKGVKR